MAVIALGTALALLAQELAVVSENIRVQFSIWIVAKGHSDEDFKNLLPFISKGLLHSLLRDVE